MNEGTPILTVTIHDCEVQTFRSGGKGGQNQNKRDTGVRVIHRPSGARGESREERSQLQNKKLAFRRMVDTPQFRYWVAVETGRIEDTEKYLARMMRPENIKVEYRQDRKWVEVE
jgi:hypothetical protein